MPTYYVDDATGDDGDDGLSEGNAFATIDHAANTVAAGDHVYIKNTNDYTELVTIDTLGTAIASIIYEGYASTPGDGGMVTIDASGLNNGVIYSSGSYIYHVFRNITVENATYDGWNLSSRYAIMFENCQANGNGSRGFDCGGFITLVDCVADGNTSDGVYVENDMKLVGGQYKNNGGYGVRAPGYSGLALYAEVYSNASYAMHVRRGSTIAHCTVDGDSKDSNAGIHYGGYSDFGQVLVNNIIYDCALGIVGDPSPCDGMMIGRNNLVNANTTAYTDWPTDAQATDITDAPGFTNEAGGDYTLAASSDARNAGYDGSGSSSPGTDIGAHQSADAGGGGGKVVITG